MPQSQLRHYPKVVCGGGKAAVMVQFGIDCSTSRNRAGGRFDAYRRVHSFSGWQAGRGAPATGSTECTRRHLDCRGRVLAGGRHGATRPWPSCPGTRGRGAALLRPLDRATRRDARPLGQGSHLRLRGRLLQAVASVLPLTGDLRPGLDPWRDSRPADGLLDGPPDVPEALRRRRGSRIRWVSSSGSSVSVRPAASPRGVRRSHVGCTRSFYLAASAADVDR